MSRFMSGLLPGRNMRWRLVGVFAILLAVILPSSTAIAAGPTRFTTTANIQLMPGSAVIQVAPDQFTVSDLIFGCIASSNWDAVPAESQDCDPLGASLIMHQTLNTTVKPGGNISGHASGNFYANGFQGYYEARIRARYDPAYGVNPNTGYPNLVYEIDERGSWSGTNGQQTAGGTLKITIRAKGMSGGSPIMIGEFVATGS